jgi:cobalt-precorrin 5A hydrolase
MGLQKTMIAAGVGCRRGASAAAVEAAIAAALAQAGVGAEALSMIATATMKGREGGIASAATRLRRPLVLVSRADLEAAACRTLTRSKHVLAALDVPSVAEAAALAVGGPTAYLLGPRIALGPATCALAEWPPP